MLTYHILFPRYASMQISHEYYASLQIFSNLLGGGKTQNNWALPNQ